MLRPDPLGLSYAYGATPAIMTQQSAQTDETARYWAFISYSHADEKWAAWLHNKLERYRVPRALRRQRAGHAALPKRIAPVFRDRDELAGSADLSATIAEALAASRSLIVICSPNAAASRYVDEEIRQFGALGGGDRVLSLLIDGEPNASERPECGLPEAFPDALRFKVNGDGSLADQRAEPIAADVRPGKDGKTNALLKIIAGVLGVGFDELKQREKHRRRLRQLQGSLAAMAVIAAIVGVWWVQSQQTDLQEQIAQAHALAPLAQRLLNVGATQSETGTLLAAHSLQRLMDLGEPIEAPYRAVRRGLSLLPARPVQLPEHRGAVANIAISPDGRWVATRDDSELRVWDVDEQTTVARAALSPEAGNVVFSPGSKWLAYTSGREVRVLRVEDWTDQAAWTTPGAPVEIVATSGDDRWLAWFAESHVYVGDVFAAQGARRVMPVEKPMTARFVGGNRYLAITTHEATSMYDLTRRQLLDMRGLTGHLPRAFSRDGRWLVTGEKAGPFTQAVSTLRIWDTDAQKPVSSFELNRRGGAALVTGVVFDRTGAVVAASSANQSNVGAINSMTKVVRRDSGSLIGQLDHSDYVSPAAISPNGQFLLVSLQMGKDQLWNVTAERLVAEFEGPGAFDPTGNFLLLSDGPAVVLLDIESGAEVARLLHAGEAEVTNTVFSSDGRWLATSQGPNVSIWDVGATEALAQARRVRLSDATVFRGHQLIFSGDSKRVAAVGDGTVHVWDARTGAEIARQDIGRNAVILHFNTEGTLLAAQSGVTMGTARRVRIWRIGSPTLVDAWANDMVVTARFEADGESLIAWHHEEPPAIYSVADGALIGAAGDLPKPPAQVTGREEALSSDQRWRATLLRADDAASIHISDTTTGTQGFALFEAVADAAISPDGRLVAAVDSGGYLTIGRWAPDELVAEACKRVSRGLTAEEVAAYLPHANKRTAPVGRCP